MSRFAENTSVSVEKSKSEIERILVRYGATSFMYGTSAGKAVVAFEAEGRRIMFHLPLPDRESRTFTHFKRGSSYVARTRSAADSAWEQACRQRWRALALVIKAKLEAVVAGITTFEDEFLAHIVMPDGLTVSDHVRPRIKQAYTSGDMQPLLPAPKSP